MTLPKSIKETKAGLKAKKFTAVDLVDGYLTEIKKQNQELNAFITVCADEAYAKAKLIDASGYDRPLAGVVVGHKDLFLTKGIRTTAGSKVLASYVPAYSATVVERLAAAGAILIGKTNCDAWAHGASGENSDYGSTKNPWHKDYVPGGSSSGSAAAVAANLCLAATGTDTGGSIRQPASFCGVVGLKPTYGAVSRYGVVAMASSLDSVGHLTQTAADSRAIFNVTRGPDGRDATVANGQLKRQSSSKKYKIGIPKEYFGSGLDREVEKSVLAAIAEYRKLGYDLKEVSLPHTKYAIDVYYIIQPAEVASNLGRYDGIRFGNDRNSFGEEAIRRIMLGTYVLSAGYYDAFYLKAMRVRSKIIADFDKVFGEVDALISPVAPTAAFKLGEKVNDPLQMYLSDILTVAADIAGLPGISIPSGFNKTGLPLSFQLMGPRFGEDILFDLGEVYYDRRI